MRIDINQFKTEKNTWKNHGQSKTILQITRQKECQMQEEVKCKTVSMKELKKKNMGEKYLILEPRDFS